MKKIITLVIIVALALASFSVLFALSVRADVSEAKVLSYSWYVAPATTDRAEHDGDLVAVGEIQNVGSNVLAYVDVSGVAYDSNGTLLATSSNVVYGNQLVPGQKAPFYLDFTLENCMTGEASGYVWVITTFYNSAGTVLAVDFRNVLTHSFAPGT